MFSLVVLVLGLLPAAAYGQAAPGAIADQFIVVLQPGANARTAAQTAQTAHGVQLLHIYEHALHGFAFRGSAQAAQALSHDPNVTLVSQDRSVRAALQTLPTGVDRTDADLNSTARIDGIDQRVSVNVAILDTGIDTSHPDLNVAGGTNCSTGTSFIDGNGHGTHTAGIVGALDNGIGTVGVAPGARLWAVRVLDDTASGTWSSVICGIDWVTATRTDADPTNDVAVANLSLSGPGADDGTCGTANNDALHQAICNSVAKGVVYVAAAGNSNTDAATAVPAAYDEVLTVSAIADSDGKPGGLGAATSAGADDTLASFSNWGADVDVAAPGVDILSTSLGGGYASLSGTSMAAPHVVGAVALYVANVGSANDALGVAAIRQTITDPSKGYSVAQGDPKGFTGDRDASPEPLIFVGPAAIHDVAVTAMVAPTSALQGDAAPVAVDVANQGTASEAISVTLTDTTTGSPVGSQATTLPAGAGTRLSFTWAIPSSATLGDHVLRAEAAPVAGETSTTNNSQTATTTVKQAVHDVALSGLTAPAEVVQGSSATLQVTAANQGTYAETFAVALRDTTSGATIGTQTVTNLAAGATTTLTFSWATSTGTAVGAHTLTATAGPVTGETATTNNTSSATVKVKGLMHVGDLDGISTKLTKGQWKASVTIAVHDAMHNPVANASVSGTFKQGTWSLPVSCITGTNGTCIVSSGTFPTTATSASFSVGNVTQANLNYSLTSNHDPDGDSNGTTILLSK
jgi:subtilisin family serine protease